MKLQSLKSFSLGAVFVVSLAFSSTDSEKQANAKKAPLEEKEVVRKSQPSLFPFVVAGSLAIIQKVYLKKSE